MMKAARCCLRRRQNSQPKNRLKGNKRPARYVLWLPVWAFMAEVPPDSGLLVSMVNCTVVMALAERAALSLEKWQVTPGGRDAHPRPMESEKPMMEVSVTLTVALCFVAMVTEAGVTARLNPTAVPETVTGWDVDGLCSASPL